MAREAEGETIQKWNSLLESGLEHENGYSEEKLELEKINLPHGRGGCNSP